MKSVEICRRGAFVFESAAVGVAEAGAVSDNLLPRADSPDLRILTRHVDQRRLGSVLEASHGVTGLHTASERSGLLS